MSRSKESKNVSAELKNKVVGMIHAGMTQKR